MIVLIDYGSGNLRSVEKALAWVGGDVRTVSASADVLAADAVVLPGVGAFGDCVTNLAKLIAPNKTAGRDEPPARPRRKDPDRRATRRVAPTSKTQGVLSFVRRS